MKIIPQPSQGAPNLSPTQTQTAQVSTSAEAARARALAMIVGNSGNTQATPVQNPNNISVEESSALKSEPEVRQADTIVESPKTESTEEVTTASSDPKDQEVPLSTQYANLARKEKALRAKAVAQEQQWKAKEAALQVKEAELASKNTIDTSKYVSVDDLKRNAFKTLQSLGIQYDEISQQALTAQSPELTAVRELKYELEAELAKVREEQANTKKSFEQQQAQAYQQALTQIRNEANQLVTTDTSFETIKETGRVNDVVKLIERTFQEEGTLLTVEQAAHAVEEHLIEEAMRLAKLSKVQSKLNPKVAAPQTAAPKNETQSPKEQQPQQMKTLTNAVSSTRPLTARERAILAMRGELNKS